MLKRELAIVVITVVFTSMFTVGFLPWIFDDNAFAFKVNDGILQCPDGNIYYNLVFEDFVSYNEKPDNSDVREFTMREGGSFGQILGIGTIKLGEVYGNNFQTEGFITFEVCNPEIGYAFKLEGTCNLESDGEVLTSIPEFGEDIAFTEVNTMCTNIFDDFF